MARRYCGSVRANVVYLDSGEYVCSVTTPDGRWCGTVLPPASGFGPGIAYDSSEAYDRTAHAALSFADDDDSSLALWQHAFIDAEGWLIARSRTESISKVRARALANGGPGHLFKRQGVAP